MKEKLTTNDIATIKKARMMSLSIFILVITTCFVVLCASIYTILKNISNIEYWVYLLVIAPVIVIFSTFKRILNFQMDIRNKSKLVMFSDCKKLTRSSDVTSHYLLIREFGEIDLLSYNYRYYFTFFSEKFEPYEIHLAPKSKVILFAKRLNP